MKFNTVIKFFYCSVVCDLGKLLGKVSMIPRAPFPNLCPLSQSDSHTLYCTWTVPVTFDICVHSNGPEAKQIHGDWLEAWGVMSSPAPQLTAPPPPPTNIPTPIHGQIVSFAASKRRKNILSVYVPECFQTIFQGVDSGCHGRSVAGEVSGPLVFLITA